MKNSHTYNVTISDKEEHYVTFLRTSLKESERDFPLSLLKRLVIKLSLNLMSFYKREWDLKCKSEFIESFMT